MAEKDQINPTYLDVSPITKGRRMLIYLADLFLNFIIAVVLFAAMVYPIARVIASSDDTEHKQSVNQQYRMDILYNNDLLNYNENGENVDKYDITSSLKYSADLYLKGFLNETYQPDYFSLFYIEYLQSEEKELKEIIKEHDDYGFFDYDKSRLDLTDSYKRNFAPLLDANDQLSNTSQSAYEHFVDVFFANVYSRLMTDLLTSDKISSESPLYQFRILDAENNEMIDKENMVAVYATYVAYLLAAIIYFLVVPLVSSTGKTIAMMALRIERVGDDNFKALARKERIIIFLYQVVLALPLIMFVPVMYISITTIFSLPYLLYLSLISLAIVFISMVFIFINRLHRSLLDFLSKSVLISKETLEQIYVTKGYMK